MAIIDNVYIGSNFEERLETLISGRSAIFITDKNIAQIYSNFFANRAHIVMGVGEVSKTLSTIDFIHSELLRVGADRHTFIVGFGGGIVTDVAGFAASTYMRGVDFGFIATTLLAQIDAGVGGKNGVNVGGYKNIAGTFNKPQFVICDPIFFDTLPAAELTAAWGEIIKCALIADPALLDVDNYEDIVVRCVAIKNAIVSEDFTEQGRRKLLNLGHTFGHSIEKCTGGTRYLHGQAVAIGIGVAARISAQLGLLSDIDCKVIENAIIGRGLEAYIAQDIDKEQLIDCAMADKKHSGSGVDMILLRGIGAPTIVNISRSELLTLTL